MMAGRLESCDPAFMPTEYVISGPDMTHGNAKVTPKAPIYYCEVCNFKGAPFGVKRGDEVLSYCGWRDNEPVCVGRGHEPLPPPAKTPLPW
jgi:hypothetical protein